MFLKFSNLKLHSCSSFKIKTILLGLTPCFPSFTRRCHLSKKLKSLISFFKQFQYTQIKVLMAIQVNNLTLLCLVKRKDGEWDVPTHHSKKCEYSVHDICTGYAFKKENPKTCINFCPKHNKRKYIIMISLSFYFITFLNLSRLEHVFL